MNTERKIIMKRIIAFLLLVVMVFTLAACGGNTVSVDDVKAGNVTLPPQTDDQGNVIEGNFAVPSVGYDGSEVTVVFGHTMGQSLQKVLNEHQLTG